MSDRKVIEVLIKQARIQGWEIAKTPGGHYRWTSPLGSFFFSAFSPSDHRAVKNIERDLRVNGFIDIKRKKGRR